MDKEVKELLELGIIRPSKSPWAAPALLVKKKDSGVRLCVDYRWLNGVTKADPFPLPHIDELLDKLSRATHIATLDLKRDCHQLPVHSDSISKTAFIMPNSKWEYTRMPFGLKNGPSVFQRLMNTTLTDLTGFAVTYIDDIVIYSQSLTDHCTYLDGVISRLEKTGLVIKLAKWV